MVHEILPKPVAFVWYNIEADNLPVRCSSCGQYRKPEDCIYIVRDDGLPDLIIEKKCITQEWMDTHECLSPPNKKRTAARIWRTRPTKLKLVPPPKPKKEKKKKVKS